MDSSISITPSEELNINRKRSFIELEMKNDYENQPNSKKRRINDNNVNDNSEVKKQLDINEEQSEINYNDIEKNKCFKTIETRKINDNNFNDNLEVYKRLNTKEEDSEINDNDIEKNKCFKTTEIRKINDDNFNNNLDVFESSDNDEEESEVNDDDRETCKSSKINGDNVDLMYELSDGEEQDEDSSHCYSINDLKKKYGKSSYMTIDDYLNTPVKISNKIKPYMVAKLIYKNASSLNLAPHKCIFEDNTGKIEVYIYPSISMKMDNLRLNKWYFLTDVYGKCQSEVHVKYLKLSQLVVVQVKPTSIINELCLGDDYLQYKILPQTVDQKSIINRNGKLISLSRSIKYYTQIKKKPIDCKMVYDFDQENCRYEGNRNISGRLLSVESKKTNDNSTYFQCEITDGTDNLKINIFNVFDHDKSAFDKLKSQNGIIGFFNFIMKIKDGLKIFSLSNNGYYKFDVICPINSIDVLSNVNHSTQVKVVSKTNASLLKVKRILNNKSTPDSEWFTVEAKIDEISYPFTKLPFKFWLTNYSIYGSYDIEDNVIINDQNNLTKSVDEHDVQVKYNIAVDLSNEITFKNLNLSKKAVEQLYPTLKDMDIKQSFYLWKESTEDFENELFENVNKWFKFKINIFYFRNQYRVMIKGIELMK